MIVATFLRMAESVNIHDVCLLVSTFISHGIFDMDGVYWKLMAQRRNMTTAFSTPLGPAITIST